MVKLSCWSDGNLHSTMNMSYILDLFVMNKRIRRKKYPKFTRKKAHKQKPKNKIPHTHTHTMTLYLLHWNAIQMMHPQYMHHHNRFSKENK